MQFGFRKHHSTETAICCFAEQIKSYLDNGGVVGAVFSDSIEAPDNVNHNVPLSKISKSHFFFLCQRLEMDGVVLKRKQ